MPETAAREDYDLESGGIRIHLSEDESEDTDSTEA
jgi:hypothetical protein